METTRQQKIARLVQKEMADMFQMERALYGGRGMVTVTRASVSKDISYARVYVSVFGVPDKAANWPRALIMAARFRSFLSLK